jgi:myo-inositol-1(or 4)-monophosphatase
MEKNLSKFLKFATLAAKEAAKIVMKVRGKARITEYKGEGDFAVDADHKSENKIMAMIQKKYPTHNILTEETGRIDKGSEYTWVIDPVDGTLNFAHGLPFFAIAITLLKKEKPIVCVVYAPVLKEFFHAVVGKGAFLNGKRIRVSTTKKINDGFYCGNVFNLCTLKNKIGRHVVRSLGCTSLELAYIACGHLTARIRLKGYDPYDFAAGILLVTEAGGLVTTIDGKHCTVHSENHIASNGFVHKKIIQMLKRR